MRYYVESNLNNFEFWGGARDIAKELTPEQLNEIDDILDTDDITLSETEINDLFWFEYDRIAEWLGFKDFDALLEYNNDRG